MNTVLLKHLGVHEKIIAALEKSFGEKFEELEIEQEAGGCRLVLRYHDPADRKTHTIRLRDFAGETVLSAAAEAPAVYHTPEYSGYRCKDTLAFFLQAETGKPNVSINHHELRLSDSLFRLLLGLAREANNGRKGWTSLQDLREARIIPSDGYQPFSRLRSVLAGYLLEKNPREFLESNGAKQYRISVPPGNITGLSG